MTALGPSFADAELDTAPADWPPTHGPHSKMRQRARAYTPTLAEAETGRPKTRPSASCSEPATKGKHNVPGSRAKLQKHTCKRDISPTAETPQLAVLAKSWGRQQTPGSLHGGQVLPVLTPQPSRSRQAWWAFQMGILGQRTLRCLAPLGLGRLHRMSLSDTLALSTANCLDASSSNSHPRAP